MARRRALEITPGDYGPVIQRDRGDLVVLSVADPERPDRTIRRARRVWAPDVLLANGAIDERVHAAATRYHDVYAIGIMGCQSRDSVFVDRTTTGGGIAALGISAIY
jgi:hypothetical protein